MGSQLTEKQREFEKCKEKYEKLKCDVGVKMQFLDENQVDHQYFSSRIIGYSLPRFFSLDKSDEKTVTAFSQCYCGVFLG